MSDSNIPFQDIHEMSRFSYLVYNYVKYWNIQNLDALDDFLQNESSNENLNDFSRETLKQIRNIYPKSRIIKFITNKADMQCCIGENPHLNRCTIVFRGTESKRDWLYNLMVCKHQKNGTYFHRGFYRQLIKDGSFDSIVSTVQNTNKNTKWFLTGHSLGGALAVLAGYLLAIEFPELDFTIVSLGAPKIGGKSFKRAFDAQTNLHYYRLTNPKDIICKLPFFAYTHVGCLVNYNSDTRKFSTNLQTTTSNLLNISSHKIEKYVQRLDR
uniref:Lipase n=1 Tax=Megaviridae environmental sample TaxID=1737588 RepID=A0A5J6VHT9_9VIRU|nr:MAG: lipase [Megaviridae environmental sample]